jgi:RHS repeat-associated protein
MDQQTIADYPVGGAASTPTYRYVYASYIDEPVVRKGAGTGGSILYYHRNQQYSITAVTTSAGSIAERYAYTAYGLPTILDSSASVLSSSAINNRYTYTGREWDATLGLYHFRARWISPSAGRFLGRDPIGYVDGPHAYVAFFAVSGMDPTGNLLTTIDPTENLEDDSAEDDDDEYPTVGDIYRCENVCAKMYPHWYQYHLFVGCIVGCNPAPVVEQQIDNVDTVVCTTFVVVDVITVPSGEGAAGCLATKSVTRQIKQCVKTGIRRKRPGRRQPRSPSMECRCFENEHDRVGYKNGRCRSNIECLRKCQLKNPWNDKIRALCSPS